MGRIEGNWATLLLPLNADESIDYPMLVKEIRYLVSAGVSGIYSNGTAGEFISLSEEEFRVNLSPPRLRMRQCGDAIPDRVQPSVGPGKPFPDQVRLFPVPVSHPGDTP